MNIIREPSVSTDEERLYENYFEGTHEQCMARLREVIEEVEPGAGEEVPTKMTVRRVLNSVEYRHDRLGVVAWLVRQ